MWWWLPLLWGIACVGCRDEGTCSHALPCHAPVFSHPLRFLRLTVMWILPLGPRSALPTERSMLAPSSVVRVK